MTASDQAKKALEYVTPGPWFAESGHEQQNGQLYWQVTDSRDAIMQNQYCWCQGDHAANARFIAWARGDEAGTYGVPALLAENAAKDAEIARLRELSERKTFPILGGRGVGVDWQLVADHGEQAQTNHSQTVARLAERGGLSWCELFAVLHNRRWQKIDQNEAMIACRALEARYLAALKGDTHE